MKPFSLYVRLWKIRKSGFSAKKSWYHIFKPEIKNIHFGKYAKIADFQKNVCASLVSNFSEKIRCKPIRIHDIWRRITNIDLRMLGSQTLYHMVTINPTSTLFSITNLRVKISAKVEYFIQYTWTCIGTLKITLT